MNSRFCFLLIAQILFLTSCSSISNPLAIDMKPKQEPMYNFTQSSALLSCVGSRIEKSSFGGVDVFISTIPDHTTPPIVGGFLTKDAVMMVTTALGRLGTNKVAIVGKNGGIKGRRQIQVLGAFTELNRTVQSSAISSDVVLPGNIEIGAGRDSNVNHIALDLAMSERNRIIPGSPTSVSVHILGSGGDATITYDDGGDFAIVGAVGYSRQEGFHSASRLLVETAVAIMMANFHDVDIKDCLQKNKKPNVRRQKTPYDKPVFDHEDINIAPSLISADDVRKTLGEDTYIKRNSRFSRRKSRNSRANYSRNKRAQKQFYKPSASPYLENRGESVQKRSNNVFDFSNKGDVKSLLLNAGIPLGGSLMEGRVGDSATIYSWKVDGVVGQLYTTSQPDKNNFSFMVNKYLKDYIANCSDGGVVSSRNDIAFEQNKLVFYELGCSNSVDGVFFLENNDSLNIFSHRSIANNKMAWKFNRDIIGVLKGR